ncbi:MAG: BlaI/MecI/CopY family transcriptional regulator [Catalinimonas sp.]
MKELTRAEEEIMQVLWRLKKGVVRDVIAALPEPKPAYNTVSTVIRILEKKGFVDHEAYGKTHLYFPLVARDDYRRQSLRSLMGRYFNGSFEQMVSFFAKEENLSLREVDDLMSHLKDELNPDDDV